MCTELDDGRPVHTPHWVSGDMPLLSSYILRVINVHTFEYIFIKTRNLRVQEVVAARRNT
jgi:hypothetical protein